MKKTIILNSILIATIVAAAFGAGFAFGHRPTPKELYSILTYEGEPSQSAIDYCNNDPEWCRDVWNYDEFKATILKMMITMPEMFDDEYLKAVKIIKRNIQADLLANFE